MIEDWQNGGFGIYIHWPFCASKCPYCDFNSHVAAAIDERRWRAAYAAEIARIAAETPGRVVRSIFFGGGTPSLMSPDLVHDTLQSIGSHWTLGNDVEITLEANPGSSDAARFRAFGEAGVNRLSMGLQALNDADLRRLGRGHTVQEAKDAFLMAREIFDRVSFDLIYARQFQTLRDWEAELKEAVAMAVDHLSLYQLTIEEGTVFARRALAGALPGLPNDDQAAGFYDITEDICTAACMAPYEVSNYARPDAESRHNTLYWRYGDYAGIGPGAHGRLTIAGKRQATESLRHPDAWLKAVETSGTGESLRENLSPEDQRTECLLMGLRLREGVSLSRLAQLTGQPVAEQTIAELTDLGMLSRADDRIAATSAGRKVLNSVILKLLED